jgi:hypothetical protein
MPGNAPALTDDRQLLLAYLNQQRDGIRNAAYGLNDQQIRQTSTVSTLTIGGLLNHLVDVERSWTARIVGRHGASEDSRSRSERESSYEDRFRVDPDATPAALLAGYAEAVAETDAVLAAVDFDEAVPVPRGVPWFPADLDAWSVRWVVLHLIEETARHAGHADIIRESIDGATMYELMAAAEGWPATDWLQPWQPPS